MARNANSERLKQRSAFTLIELLVVISIVAILVAVLLPAVQHARETARRAQCTSNLKQIALAIHLYQGTYRTYPPGYAAVEGDPTDGKSWGWSAMLLPFLEQQPLADRLAISRVRLSRALASPQLNPLLQTSLSIYRCPSDTGESLAHPHRTFSSFQASAFQERHENHPTPEKPAELSAQTATSNYVGVMGSHWNANGIWTRRELENNGVLACNSSLNPRDLRASGSIMLVSERNWKSYAAVWAGVEYWDHCVFQGNQMVLGTTFYAPNSEPDSYFQSCASGGAAGFTSYHPSCIMAAFADGSVRSIPEAIDLQLYRKLGQVRPFLP